MHGEAAPDEAVGVAVHEFIPRLDADVFRNHRRLDLVAVILRGDKHHVLRHAGVYEDHRRNDNELPYMCALTAVTLADAIAFKYNFYDDIYSENLLLWITAAVVLSKGIFFKSQTLLLATVNFVLMVVLIYMRESEDLQNNITNHVIPLFCFMQSVKFISIATAKTLKSHKNRFTVTRTK
jgi:hypothetical protein